MAFLEQRRQLALEDARLLGAILCGQHAARVGTVQAREQMPGSDEAAEQAVPVDVGAEITDAASPQAVARFPVGARGLVELSAQVREIGVDVRACVGLAEEAAEGGVVGKVR